MLLIFRFKKNNKKHKISKGYDDYKSLHNFYKCVIERIVSTWKIYFSKLDEIWLFTEMASDVVFGGSNRLGVQIEELEEFWLCATISSSQRARIRMEWTLT
jgi:hypothetical protein